MGKFPEADARFFKNKYVCRRCKAVLKTPVRKVFDKSATCRKCAGHHFKPKRKK
ncbi:50S ribosomal protein L40e [archaeon]|nr:50S ribosomal protein L40e [archaeon]